MVTKEICDWVMRNEQRVCALQAFIQPLTVTQLARRIDLSLRRSSSLVRQLRLRDLVFCLNDAATQNRIYWLTHLGLDLQRSVIQASGLEALIHDLPDVDWGEYAWLCNRHREAIIRTLTRPMQPREIKRKAWHRDPNLRMSTGNCREVLRQMRKRGLVRTVYDRGNPYPRFELSDDSKQYQRLLFQAMWRGR